MDKGTTSSPGNSFQTHFVDVHEALPEDDEEEEERVIKMEDKVTKKGLHKPTKLRELKRPHSSSFSRKVSLETGFSVLHKESKAAKDDRKVLQRNGRSFGGFDSATRAGGEPRKGDFNIFRTKPTLSKQNSLLPTRKERDMESQRTQGATGLDVSPNQSVPIGRYFAALRGPELDQVKNHEDILLPKDEIWPFLRFPIGCFGICLGLSSQAVLWRALSTSPATKFLHITPFINLFLWLLALAVLVSVSITYLLKCIYYFEAVKREYFPSRGKRRLSKVENPSSHLSVVGNFVGAILASKVRCIEAARFLWSVGFAHYLVVFVTLYQRLPTSEALPKELHPVTCLFIALFLYISLVVRINFFTGFRFSVAWWSYTFPMTTASVATIKYAEQVPSVLSKGLALSLSFMSSAMVSVLFVSTLRHAFVLQTLFPNDLAIAITKTRPVKDKKPFKKAYDIKRWTKQALTKNNSGYKEINGQ
ncbi:hypothetical protein PTKIN_Ptkin04bG0198000 [Pterospermum kingtungense]